jgi:hypothetical protein
MESHSVSEWIVTSHNHVALVLSEPTRINFSAPRSGSYLIHLEPRRPSGSVSTGNACTSGRGSTRSYYKTGRSAIRSLEGWTRMSGRWVVMLVTEGYKMLDNEGTGGLDPRVKTLLHE